ncbi:uncharacterized protein [Drosophila tropicalis]|uniref:uncharacterized protein n=1 Tax=Drosophila tropicalis TaxID=46794 RepID=UPI0035ABF4D7
MPVPPQMALLPIARLAAYQRPFTYVGIDYFGPFLVAVGRRSEKKWGGIFTCLTIRAVYIELACFLDTPSCIMCIGNLINRRGIPREIYSDNATNFKAAEKIICDKAQTINFNAVQPAFDDNKWKFNPPAALHMGVTWERLVRPVKAVLYAICPARKFTSKGLQSALCEVEFILNSRPLTFETAKTTRLSPLTTYY